VIPSVLTSGPTPPWLRSLIIQYFGIFVTSVSDTKSLHQTFYKIWDLKFKTSFQRRFCSAESAITRLAQSNALGPKTTGTFALKGQNKNYAAVVVVPLQGGDSWNQLPGRCPGLCVFGLSARAQRTVTAH